MLCLSVKQLTFLTKDHNGEAFSYIYYAFTVIWRIIISFELHILYVLTFNTVSEYLILYRMSVVIDRIYKPLYLSITKMFSYKRSPGICIMFYIDIHMYMVLDQCTHYIRIYCITCVDSASLYSHITHWGNVSRFEKSYQICRWKEEEGTAYEDKGKKAMAGFSRAHWSSWYLVHLGSQICDWQRSVARSFPSKFFGCPDKIDDVSEIFVSRSIHRNSRLRESYGQKDLIKDFVAR